MNLSPDQVLEELRQITTELAAVHHDDSARADLLERRDQLRDLARLTHLALAGSSALERELEHLRRRLADLDRERVQIPKWQQYTGGRLTDPEAAGRGINRKLDTLNALDRASLERRAADIEAMLGEDEVQEG